MGWVIQYRLGRYNTPAAETTPDSHRNTKLRNTTKKELLRVDIPTEKTNTSRQSDTWHRFPRCSSTLTLWASILRTRYPHSFRRKQVILPAGLSPPGHHLGHLRPDQQPEGRSSSNLRPYILHWKGENTRSNSPTPCSLCDLYPDSFICLFC